MTTAALTVSSNAAILNAPLTHSADEFDSSNLIGAKPLSMRFFYAQRPIFLCEVGRGGLTACRLRLAGLSTPFNLAPLFDSFRCGFYNLINRAHIMAQNPLIKNQHNNSVSPKTAVFDAFYHRRIIAQGIPGAVAERLKAYYPACIVKFSGMTGGAA